MSRKPVPLLTFVAEELKEWKKVSLYSSEDDLLFPPVAKNGTQPLAPDMMLRRHIRPALKKIGVMKRVGFHTFRHTLATLLRQHGVDIKTAQELLRPANPRITMGIYQQAVTAEKRSAQNLVFSGLLLQHPRRELERSNHCHKPWVLNGLWRGRRGSNPRPLP